MYQENSADALPYAMLGAAAIVYASLPPPEYLGTATGAIIAGGLGGLGIGYAAWQKQKTKADIARFQALEIAQKGTSLRTIQDLTATLSSVQEQLVIAERRILDSEREEAEAKTEADRLRHLVLDFAKDILQTRGYLAGDEPKIPTHVDG